MTVASKGQTGLWLMVFGLVLGGGFYVDSRLIGGRRASGPYGRATDQMTRVLVVPLIVVGVIGAILWGFGSAG